MPQDSSWYSSRDPPSSRYDGEKGKERQSCDRRTGGNAGRNNSRARAGKGNELHKNTERKIARGCHKIFWGEEALAVTLNARRTSTSKRTKPDCNIRKRRHAKPKQRQPEKKHRTKERKRKEEKKAAKRRMEGRKEERRERMNDARKEEEEGSERKSGRKKGSKKGKNERRKGEEEGRK